MIKTGTRLQSQVCDTQVIVVRSSERLDDLRAGGVPMIPLDGEKTEGAQLDPDFAAGTVMGKRYVDADGAELLVTKAGAGSLSVGTTPLEQKTAKPLPASD
ncbi:hypothetical protein [Mycolicibacterium rhodesiae]|uniref:Uncharacterized protein n=1 Tax=Mycolicibacterium rhodesiae TaxID=36814 RepID=A0A1X0ITV9_MYCRH|nr:hypothetical protein [Mycolicibacterium rhodesiae]MCV7345882.1 hypothetical protein [Mycolicibacterium rhodesiae]ORB52197.1 hypothetical protein BST42_14540 [Mycolicibacterium rhodesiae]